MMDEFVDGLVSLRCVALLLFLSKPNPTTVQTADAKLGRIHEAWICYYEYVNRYHGSISNRLIYRNRSFRPPGNEGKESVAKQNIWGL
ncbi:hypothetical protein BO85DRAFT_454595 [Aspergillus piperis CBS 112811]|uniref:Uncharacterized protein n=1 Tax=Aspergillus piperis CBS 112811 TaxID=1448313 RepID=A0A8G1QQH6_9EURO|nr:hypothetical protein BO85DRAFT_454595 [Aspergillus piperis CBS 112811]RAH51744.1 hypothetical protein BO85DRAFT_454595 [Aspergillus piperis CBS 112811]